MLYQFEKLIYSTCYANKMGGHRSCLNSSLRWYYDQNSPYLFFLHFESMIYKYLPCQILGHDSARHYLIQQWPSSKESWVEGGCDVIQSRHLNKRGYLRMQKRSAVVMFYPSSRVFCLRSPWKRLCRQIVALFDWMTSHPPSTQLPLLN